MASITIIVVDFILAVLACGTGGWIAFRPNPTVSVSFGNIFLVILTILLFLQVMKIIPTCG